MAKTDFTTGTAGQSVHGRTTAGADKSQVVVIGTDASDAVLDPATLATQTTLAAVLARLAGATPHADAAGTGDVALTAVAGRLMSFSAAEATGSASAKFYLRDGTSSAGTIVAIVTLAAGESIRDSFGPNGIALATGLYLDRVSGSTEVTAAVV